ncbi:MAG TPA: PEP-CTERM sorting domain-containing protein [Armatimonadota bacterium]|jgi:MYXO-CTERM domain-containing protein
MQFQVPRGLATLLVALACMAVLPAEAQVSLVTDRPLLGATDQVDWAQLGAGFEVLVPPYATAYFDGGLAVSIETGYPFMQRLDTSPYNLPGVYPDGEALICVGPSDPYLPGLGMTGPMEITLAAPVSGVGTQIQSADFALAYAAIYAYDSTGGLLGSFVIPAQSGPVGPPEAAYLGVTSATANISKVVFETRPGPAPDGWSTSFAIGHLDLACSTVPEPASLALGLLGLGPLALLRRRRS